MFLNNLARPRASKLCRLYVDYVERLSPSYGESYGEDVEIR